MKRRRKYWFWSRKGKSTKMCLLCCYGKIWRLYIPEVICPSFNKHYLLSSLKHDLIKNISFLKPSISFFKPSINQAFFMLFIHFASVWLLHLSVPAVRSILFKRLYKYNSYFDNIMWRKCLLEWNFGFVLCVTGLLLWSKCEGAFKSTMLEKKTVLFSQAWEPSPLLRLSSNHFGVLAPSLDNPFPNPVSVVRVHTCTS